MANEDGTRLDRLQRRDLQPRRASAASSRRAATATARTATPRRSSTSTRSRATALRRATARHVRLRDLGPPRRELLLARDRLGIKPLYYALTGTELLFASEIKALLAGGAVRAALQRRGACRSSSRTASSSGDETLFRGMSKARCPATSLTWSRRRASRRAATGTLPSPTSDAAGHGGVESRRAKCASGLEEAVRSHLMSDVPLGVFLSGGIDSSAHHGDDGARMVDEPIRTFSVGVRASARPTSWSTRGSSRDAFGTEHHEVVVTPGRVLRRAAAARLARGRADRVHPSSVPLYFVSRLAREHVKVVLTGEGGDELLPRLQPLSRDDVERERLGGRTGRAMPSGWRRGVRNVVDRCPRPARRYAERSFLAHGARTSAICSSTTSRCFPHAPQRAAALSNRRCWIAATRMPAVLQREDGTPRRLLDRMSRADPQTYLHELLMKQDQMSMAASIESRVPFLDDHARRATWRRMPGTFKVRGWQTKAVLRAAVADLLPPAILTRPKMGFPVPLGAWLRGAFRSVVDDFVLGGRAPRRAAVRPGRAPQLAAEHRSGARAHGDRLWPLVNLEIWQRIFLDGESPDEVMRAVSRTSIADVLCESSG